MVNICTKCGAGIPEGNQFCAACGTPVGAAAAFAAPSQPVAPLQPMVAPAKSGGGSALKIILIIVAVFVGLGMVGLGIFGYAAWRISRAVHVDGATGQVTLHTAEGTLSASAKQTFTAAELGTEIYPGAQAVEGGARMDMPDGSMVTGVFVTSDSPAQVVSFYKSKAGPGSDVIDTGETAVITLKLGEKNSVMISITSDPAKSDGKTQIHIVHTVDNKAS